MAKVGAQRAAELTSKSKSTIQRAMNSGKLSYEIDANNRRIIDVSELDRVFGLKNTSESNPQQNVEAEMKKAADMLEMERMKMRIRMLEDQLDTAKEQVEDLKAQRDQWQKQAQQVLLTSEYSQKQAEEYKAQLKEREEKARARKAQMLEDKMKNLKGQNQNQAMKGKPGEKDESGNFQGLWKKIKGERKSA
ncbi:MAG: entry exclusion 1 domain-containing protein [Pseudomonadota bacterium]